MEFTTSVDLTVPLWSFGGLIASLGWTVIYNHFKLNKTEEDLKNLTNYREEFSKQNKTFADALIRFSTNLNKFEIVLEKLEERMERHEDIVQRGFDKIDQRIEKHEIKIHEQLNKIK